MIGDQRPRPANMDNVVAINQGLRPHTMGEPELMALLVDDAVRLVKEGCLVIDARRQGDFGQYHIPGSLNTPLSSTKFEQNVGWILPDDAPFLLVTDDWDSARSAVRKLAFVGLDQRARGHVSFGAWRKATLPCDAISQVDVTWLHRKITALQVGVLDVRDAAEWEAGRIESACHMDFKRLSTEFDRLDFTPDDRIAVVCSSGIRSSTASSILRRNGLRHLYNVDGGMQAWCEAGLPVTTRPGAGRSRSPREEGMS